MGDHSDIDHTGLTGVGGGTPDAHAASHEDGGSDEIDVTGLVGAGGSADLTDYGEVERVSTDLTTSSTSYVDATSLTRTLTTAAVRCMVVFSAVVSCTSSGTVSVDVAVDGTRQGQTLGLVCVQSAGFATVSFTFFTDVLTAASHTIKIQWRVSAGTGTMWSSAAITPARLTIIETALAA